MTDLVLLPAALNLTVSAGNAYALRIEWPTGSDLESRTFEASLDARTLAVELSSDGALMVFFSEDDTGAVLNPSRWILRETTGGIDQKRIVGGVRTSPYGTDSFADTVTVVSETATLTIVTTGAPGPRGLVGDTGPQGDVGDTGPEGPIGDTGPAGADSTVPGPPGDTGPQGPKGDTGATGAKGAKGDVGSQGPQGPQGIQGAAGAKGDTGDTGPAGATGDTGAAGAKGDTGVAGPTGDTGPAGAAGAAGAKGATGDTGPAGAAGAKGATGDTGATGPQGVKGDAGAAGAKGATGDTGPAGPTGAIADPGANGYIARTALNTFAARSILGTAAEIDISNPTGAAGNSVASLPAAITLTGKTLTGGTHTGGTWEAGAIGGVTPAAVTATDVVAADVTVSGARSVSNIAAAGGVGFRGVARTVTDPASTGTNATNFGMHSIAADTIAAASPTTYSGAPSSLYIAGPPVAGANVTFSGVARGFTNVGSTLLQGGTTVQSGITVTGTVNLVVNNSTNVANIGTGTTSGTVSIGGGANTVSIGSRLALSGSYNTPSIATTPGAFSIAAATYTDTSSSGTIATNWGVSQIGIPTLAASSATTYSGGIATLTILGAPVAGTNVTISGAARALDVTGGVILRNGVTISGAVVNLNASSNSTVNIATGTSTGTVTIGSGSNQVGLNSILSLAQFTVGTLPTASGNSGRIAWASNARRVTGTNIATGVFTTEGAAAGTGAIVESDGTNWKICGTTVTAAA